MTWKFTYEKAWMINKLYECGKFLKNIEFQSWWIFMWCNYRIWSRHISCSHLDLTWTFFRIDIINEKSANGNKLFLTWHEIDQEIHTIFKVTAFNRYDDFTASFSRHLRHFSKYIQKISGMVNFFLFANDSKCLFMKIMNQMRALTFNAWAASSCVATLRLIPFTLRIWSPLLSSPQRSAGPPAKMKDMKMPSPSSPPTILKPRPEPPLCSTTVLTSLQKKGDQWRLT